MNSRSSTLFVEFTMPFWMTVAEWSSRLILVFLIFLSVWSVKIMVDRKRFFKQLSSSDNSWKSKDQFETRVETYKKDLEKGLPVLGTLGSTAPFIGLLGTILGIIKAFGELSVNAMNTNRIMFLLAEALILTAVGLAVAIPSVIAFNYFQRKVKQQLSMIRAIHSDNQSSPR
ncbi:MAG: MotA/TolQ/ExbB proton channel family protein [Bdellovibrionota bacterium]